MQKIFKYKDEQNFIVDSWEDVQKICSVKHSIQPFQVSYYTDNVGTKNSESYYVTITNKFGEVFAVVGNINFNPNESKNCQ